MADQILTCKEKGCGQEFVFEEGEQKFFADRGFTPPTRCKPCRQRRKAEREANENQNY